MQFANTKTELKKVTLDVYNSEGAVVAHRELDPTVFGVTPKEEVLHLAVVAQDANARRVHASTKGKGEVRGGGKKPWKQKGTGRARHGSIRSPIWRGGGIVFGPRANRNYSLKINKKVKKKALCMVLSARAHEGRIILLDALEIPSAKTTQAARTLAKLPVIDFAKGRKSAVITPPHTPELSRSLRNLPRVSVIPARSLNVKDLIASPSLVIPLASLESIEKQYGTVSS
ncbi:50S ribosomal protein L4 [Candidatus Uhrbacteria bacterium]|nr:50S ribosomal protein L4 [Candidatus Uhrbacteria bacterium]